MYRTVTDLAYSRSPECPFIIDEPSMADLRSRLDGYEENTLLPPDAQIGMRKLIAAALGERKGRTPEGRGKQVVWLTIWGLLPGDMMFPWHDRKVGKHPTTARTPGEYL
jgi:hypothetical protein